MTIETKFNINDEVWFIHPKSQQAVSGRVIKIMIRIESQPMYKRGERRDLIRTGEFKPRIFVHLYTVWDKINTDGITKDANQLFANKEELIMSI